ncbi:MAG: TfoX/Sxy family protein [Planctomycetales bacterium]|nr:TfoX/Sxy family protein [Planctomycetales bacterium]
MGTDSNFDGRESPPARGAIEGLANLGPTSALWLRQAGIESIEQLTRLGAVAAYRLVRERQPRASLNLLWALAAGLEGRDWRELRAEEKARLREALARLDQPDA